MSASSNPDFWLALAGINPSAAGLTGRAADEQLLLSLAGLSEQADGTVSAKQVDVSEALERFLCKLAGLAEEQAEQPIEDAVTSTERTEQVVEPLVIPTVTTEEPSEPLRPDDEKKDKPPREVVKPVAELSTPAPAKPRRSAIAAALITILALASVATGFFLRGLLWKQSSSQETIEQLNEVTRLLDDQQFKAASQLLRSLDTSDPALISSDRLHQLSERLKDLAERESKRIASFERQIIILGQSMPACLDEIALERARRFAKTDVEWNSISKFTQQITRHRELLSAIARAVGDVAAFRERLREYSHSYPNLSRTKDFQQISDIQFNAFETIEKWNHLLDRLAADAHGHLKPDLAAQLLAKSRSLFDSCENLPGAGRVKNAIAELKSTLVRTKDGDEGIRQQFVELFSNPVLRAPAVFEWTNGDLYYLSHADGTQLSDGKTRFAYFGDLQGTAKSFVISSRQIGDRVKSRGEHIAFLNELAADSSDLSPETWDSTFVSLLTRLRSTQLLTAPVKVYLMTQTLRLGCLGSQRLSNAFGNYLAIIESAGLNRESDWLNPFSEGSKLSRHRAAKTLRIIDGIHVKCIATAWGDAAEVSPVDRSRLLWIGWLRRGVSDEWLCESASHHSFENGAPIYIVERDSIDTPIVLLQIGEYRHDPPRYRFNKDAHSIEGLPIFTIRMQ